MAQWIFDRLRPGSAGGDAFRNTFEGGDTVKALAREAIQNSVDAALPKQMPRIDFVLTNHVDLRPVLNSEFCDHARKGGLALTFDLSDASVLFVEDYKTTGLTGSMGDTNSNFFRLMGQLGGSHKADGSGGSFGYGKAASILNSGCNSVLAYTITRERLPAFIGATYIDPHQEYTGLGWFGSVGAAGEPSEVTGEAATKLAEALQFPRSKSPQPGTSLAILAPTCRLSILKEWIERYWWPRLEDHDLSITIRDGHTRHDPQPQHNPSLQPQLDLYGIIRGRNVKKPADHVANLEHLKHPTGTLALRFLNEDRIPDGQPDSDDFTTLGSISLMRQTRMVIDYYRWTNSPRVDCVGVFLADPSIEEDLRRTETLAHDQWSKDATRASAAQRDLAHKLILSIRSEYRKYVKAYEPPPETDDSSLSDIRRYFGSLFGSWGSTGGSSPADPIQIAGKTSQVTQHGSSLVTTGSATIRWTGPKQQPLRIRAGIRIAESDLASSGDYIASKLFLDGHEATGAPPEAVVQFKPKQAVTVRFQSGPYDPEWTSIVDLRVSEEDVAH